MASPAPLADSRRAAGALILYVLLAALALWQASRLGGFSSDLGGDPDEGAHAVTSLMMKDYLCQGLPAGGSPLAFAEKYYQTFPKVALGHYPPVYYLPAAGALMLWCDPRCLIVLQGLLAALLGLQAAALVRRAWPQAGRGVAVLGGVAVVLHGEVARVSAHVLSDLLLAVLVLLAVRCWMAWLERPSWRAALLFGLTAAVAILTKGSALGLAGIPVFSLLLTRRWADLKRLSWWGAGLPVVVLAAPWMLWSVRFTKEGFTGDTPQAFFVKAVGEYAQMAPWFFHWPLLLGGGVAVVRLAGRFWRSPEGIGGCRAVLAATFLGMQGIAMVVPAGFSPRYLLPSLVPVMVLVLLEACAGVAGSSRQRLARGLAACLLISTAVLAWRQRPKEVHGYAHAVEAVLAWPGAPTQRAWLVSSDGRGEGALIAAAAFRTPDRPATTRRILRGSKEIADTDWAGRHYESRFPTPAALLAHLDKRQVDVVLVDLSMPAADQKPHETALRQALGSAPTVWEKQPDQPVTRLAGAPAGPLEIYRRIRSSP